MLIVVYGLAQECVAIENRMQKHATEGDIRQKVSLSGHNLREFKVRILHST